MLSKNKFHLKFQKKFHQMLDPTTGRNQLSPTTATPRGPAEAAHRACAPSSGPRRAWPSRPSAGPPSGESRGAWARPIPARANPGSPGECSNSLGDASGMLGKALGSLGKVAGILGKPRGASGKPRKASREPRGRSGKPRGASGGSRGISGSLGGVS